QLQLRRNYHRRRHRQLGILIADHDRWRRDLVLRQLGQGAFGSVQLVAVATAAAAARACIGNRQRQVWADIGRQANYLLLDLVLVLERPVAGPDERPTASMWTIKEYTNVSLRCGYSPCPAPNSVGRTTSCGVTLRTSWAAGLDASGVDISLYYSIDPAMADKFQKNIGGAGFTPRLLRFVPEQDTAHPGISPAIIPQQSPAGHSGARRSRPDSGKYTPRRRRLQSRDRSGCVPARRESIPPLSCRCARRDRRPGTTAAAAAYSASAQSRYRAGHRPCAPCGPAACRGHIAAHCRRQSGSRAGPLAFPSGHPLRPTA